MGNPRGALAQRVAWDPSGPPCPQQRPCFVQGGWGRCQGSSLPQKRTLLPARPRHASFSLGGRGNPAAAFGVPFISGPHLPLLFLPGHPYGSELPRVVSRPGSDTCDVTAVASQHLAQPVTITLRSCAARTPASRSRGAGGVPPPPHGHGTVRDRSGPLGTVRDRSGSRVRPCRRQPRAGHSIGSLPGRDAVPRGLARAGRDAGGSWGGRAGVGATHWPA